MQVSSDHPKGYAVFTPRAVVNEVATGMAYYGAGKRVPSDAIRDKYHGAISASYDADRTSRATWQSEHVIVAEFLEGFAEGTSLLDIPVGTSRFLEL
jgi:hypothetical protein